MAFKARWSVLAAVMMTAVCADRAAAVDPQQAGGINTDYGNPALGFGATSIPLNGGRSVYPSSLQNGSIPPDAILSTGGRGQRITIPDPNRIATSDPAYGAQVRISPISTVRPDLPGVALPPQQQARWRLGVYSKDTETGVRVVQVVNASAASTAGLEPEDIIIAVNGYQVGYVNGELFDCATEFERSATPEGWVRMLVQNNRNGKLMNLPVKLQSRLSAVSGSLTLNDRLQLPNGAYAVVELQERVRPGAPPITLARQTIDNLRQYPIPFAINYDPQQIDTRRSYVVDARVMVNRDTLYAPRNFVQVLTPGQPTNVNLALDRVAANPEAPIGPYGQDVRLEQVVQLFQQYLNREPTQRELTAFQSDLQTGSNLSQVKCDILGQPQFWNQCDGSEEVFISKLHELMLGRKPMPEELRYWMQRYDALGGVRRDVAREFINAVGGPN